MEDFRVSDHILEAVMKKCCIRWLSGAVGAFLYLRDAELLPDKRRQMDRAIADRVKVLGGMIDGRTSNAI
jgi:hypothetical protein